MLSLLWSTCRWHVLCHVLCRPVNPCHDIQHVQLKEVLWGEVSFQPCQPWDPWGAPAPARGQKRPQQQGGLQFMVLLRLKESCCERWSDRTAFSSNLLDGWCSMRLPHAQARCTTTYPWHLKWPCQVIRWSDDQALPDHWVVRSVVEFACSRHGASLETMHARQRKTIHKAFKS